MAVASVSFLFHFSLPMSAYAACSVSLHVFFLRTARLTAPSLYRSSTSALDRADRFSLVQRAADLLRQDDVLDRLVAGGAADALAAAVATPAACAAVSVAIARTTAITIAATPAPCLAPG